MPAAIRWAASCSACSATGTVRRTGARATPRTSSATATPGSKASTIGSASSSVVNPRTGAHERTIKRDYSELLPARAARFRLEPFGRRDAARRVHGTCGRPSTRGCSCGSRRRCGPASSAAATRAAPPSCSTSTAARCSRRSAIRGRPRRSTRRRHRRLIRRQLPDALLDRARYGLYPPGSTFKLLVAGAALRTQPGRAEPDVRVRAAAGRPRRAISFGAGRGRSATIRWIRRRTATSTCDTGSSSRATPTSRSSRCGSGRSRSSTPHRLFQIEAARPATPRPLRQHAAARRLRPGGCARVAAEDGARCRRRSRGAAIVHPCSGRPSCSAIDEPQQRSAQRSGPFSL